VSPGTPCRPSVPVPSAGAPGARSTRRQRICLLLLLTVVALASACGKRWLPDDFTPPTGFRTDLFSIRLLTVDDAAADYEAVMESLDIIHTALLSDRWPGPGFSVEEDRRQIAVKEERARARRSFTYAVLSPNEERVLGSVYVNPGIGGPDAAVALWVRKTAFDEGLDPILERAVRGWIHEEWPLKWVVFPGRGPTDPGDPAVAEGDGSADPLLGAYWAGAAGADEFVFRFSTGARGYEAMTYSLSGGELRQEMQATTVRVDWPEIELTFPTGASFLGRVSADGNLIDGQLLYGKDSGPTLPLGRVDDAGRYPQLPKIGGRPRE
jgi:hypothetical protein